VSRKLTSKKKPAASEKKTPRSKGPATPKTTASRAARAPRLRADTKGGAARGDARAQARSDTRAEAARAELAAEGEPRRRASAPAPSERESAAVRRHKEARVAAEAAIDAALDKKGLMPTLIDVSEQATYTDFIGIVSGRSDRQVDAIAEGVTLSMKQRGWRLLGREGGGNGRWTLLDFGDFVLHVFYHPVREFYDIEGLWIEAPRVKLKVPPEALHYQADALYDSM
jgi:ribosome-associated protein